MIISTCENCGREFLGEDVGGLIYVEYEHYVKSFGQSRCEVTHCCKRFVLTEYEGERVIAIRMYSDWSLMRRGEPRRLGDDGNLENVGYSKWEAVPKELQEYYAGIKARLIRKFGA